MNETTGFASMRERLIFFYKRQEYLLRPLVRFLVSLAVLLLLRAHLGSHGPAGAMLESTLLNVILALVCSMLPPGYSAAILGLVMVWDLYRLSLEATAICAALLMLCLLLYFRFAPRDSIVLLLMPVAYAVRLHYAVPVIAGLLFGPGAAVPIVFGLVFTKFVLLVEESLPALAGGGLAAGEQMITNFRSLIDGMMNDKGMIIMAAALAAAVLVVCFLRHLIMQHAWTVAISAGCVTELLILLAGDMRFGTQIDLVSVLIGVVLAFAAGQPKEAAPLYLMAEEEEENRSSDEFAPGTEPGE